MIPAELCNQTGNAESSCSAIPPGTGRGSSLCITCSPGSTLSRMHLHAGWELKCCSLVLAAFHLKHEWWGRSEPAGFKLNIPGVHVLSISTSTCTPLLSNFLFWIFFCKVKAPLHLHLLPFPQYSFPQSIQHTGHNEFISSTLNKIGCLVNVFFLFFWVKQFLWDWEWLFISKRTVLEITSRIHFCDLNLS